MKTATQKTIRIDVEHITEGADSYFLATSPDVKWFVFEADSMDEMMEYAPKHMEILLETRRKRLKNEIMKHSFLKNIVFNFSYNVPSSLQYV